MNTEELNKLADIYECEPWMLLAAAPDGDLLPQLKRATNLLKNLSPKQTATWLDIGDTLANPEK